MKYQDLFKSVHAHLAFYKFSDDFVIGMKALVDDLVDCENEIDISAINDTTDTLMGSNGDIWKNW